jgi:hypothetical protein
MSRQQIDQIIKHRTDMSKYLIHWTDKNHFYAIIGSGFFIASKARRPVGDLMIGWELYPTIHGREKAVCFSEMPVGNWLQSIATHHLYSERRWGIAIPKDILYAYGARPLLYGDKDFLHRLAEDDKYRFSRFCYPSGPDWTHEREWRARPNTEFNDRIGLKSEVSLSHRGQDVSGKLLVPLHLPRLDSGKLGGQLSEDPQFAIIVETEKDKEVIKQPFPPLLAEPLAQSYFPIGEYRDKYIAALRKADVVSLERARDERDRRDIWCLEDLLSPRQRSPSQRKSQIGMIVILWDKARTETRRQVLDFVREEPGGGYEYCRGCNLWHLPPGMFTRPQSIGERIEENKQAVEMLRSDVKAWIHESFGTVLGN